MFHYKLLAAVLTIVSNLLSVEVIASDNSVTNSIGIDFVKIPSGSFIMGCDKTFDRCGDNEMPAHRVSIDSFHIGKYEVTQTQWVAVMGDNPSGFKGRTNPVEGVSWQDIQVFVEKLKKIDGKQYRLPTEAEWEYAARAGTTTTYFFGDEEDGVVQYAWIEGNSGGKTHPVGQKQPNSFGLYDIMGNVLEWTCSEYAPYSKGKETKCVESSNSSRALRGGSWIDRPNFVRIADRQNSLDTSLRVSFVGFRLVVSP